MQAERAIFANNENTKMRRRVQVAGERKGGKGAGNLRKEGKGTLSFLGVHRENYKNGSNAEN